MKHSMNITRNLEGKVSYDQLYSMNFYYRQSLHAGDIVLQNSGTSLVGRESVDGLFDVDVAWNKEAKTTYEQLTIPYPEYVKQYVKEKCEYNLNRKYKQ